VHEQVESVATVQMGHVYTDSELCAVWWGNGCVVGEWLSTIWQRETGLILLLADVSCYLHILVFCVCYCKYMVIVSFSSCIKNSKC
jgi:hypothetical protein